MDDFNLPVCVEDVTYARSRKWTILTIITLAHVMSSYSVLSIQTLAPFLQADLRLNLVEIGLLTSLFYLGALFLSVPVGWLVDRAGEYWVLVVGQLIVGIFIIAVSAARSFTSVAILMVFAGIGYSGINPSTAMAVINHFPVRGRATAMSVKQIGVPTGGALVAASLPAFAVAFHWRNAFVFAGAVSILSVVVIGSFYRRGRGGRSERRPILPHPGQWSNVGEILKNRDIMLLSFLVLAFQALQLSMITHFTIYIKNTLSCSVLVAGALFSLANISGLVGRLCWGYTSDFLFEGRRKGVLMVIGGLSSLVCFAFVFLSPSFPMWLVSVLITLFGFSAMGWPGIFLTLVADLSGIERAGSAFGVCLAIVSMGFIGPPLFGFIVDRTHSYSHAWLTFALITAVATLLMVFVREPAPLRRKIEDL